MRQNQSRGVELMRTVRITRPLRTPRIVHRPGDLQGLLDLRVIGPHFAPIERPIGAIAELGARLEPFRPEAQRHHGKMHGRAADRFAGIIGAELDRIFAVRDAFVGPVKLGLLVLVRGKIFQRPPIRAGIERHHREAILCKLAGERAAPGAGADNGKIDRLILGILAHRHPAAGMEDIGSAAADRTRGLLRIIRHARSPAGRAPRDRAAPPRPPTDRAGQNTSAHNRAGSPGRQNRSRSRTWDGRNRR